MPDDMADGGLARHPRGWRVAPAPDGRGTPPAQPSDLRRPRFGRFGWFVLVLLAVNGQELICGTMTTGAESDIRQLTEIAREMVGRWGMSDRIGPVAVLPDDGAAPLVPGAGAQSEDTQQTIDQEVRRLVDDAHAEVTRMLTEHRDQLRSLAEALLEAETLDAAEAYAAAGVPARPAHLEQPPAAGVAAGR